MGPWDIDVGTGSPPGVGNGARGGIGETGVGIVNAGLEFGAGGGNLDTGPGIVDAGLGVIDPGLGVADAGLGVIDVGAGHLWKAQWKEKPNDEGHRKLTMNS